MRVLHGALLASVLLLPASAVLADEDSAMKSGKVGTANTQETSMKAEGGTAADASTTRNGQATNLDETTGGPDEDMSTQTGSANTEVGSVKPEGGSAAQGSTGAVSGDPATGPDDDLSTETGSANTEVGDTEAQGGTASQ